MGDGVGTREELIPPLAVDDCSRRGSKPWSPTNLKENNVSFEVRTRYTIYDKEGNEQWTGDHLDGYDLDDICNSLRDKFVYGCWIGDDTKEWIVDNLYHNYFFVIEETENRHTDEIIDCRTLILVSDETDAMALKLACT